MPLHMLLDHSILAMLFGSLGSGFIVESGGCHLPHYTVMVRRIIHEIG